MTMKYTSKQEKLMESAFKTLCQYRQEAGSWGVHVGVALKELETLMREDGALPERDEFLNDEGDLNYAFVNPLPTPTQVRIIWEVEDINTERPDWTEERCEQFLLKNSEAIVGRSIEEGWSVIKTLLRETEDE